MKRVLLKTFRFDMAYGSSRMSHDDAEDLLGNFVNELSDYEGSFSDLIFYDWYAEEQHTFEFATIAFCAISRKIGAICICDED